MSRPLQFMDLKAKIKSIYSVDLTVFYFNAEVGRHDVTNDICYFFVFYCLFCV